MSDLHSVWNGPTNEVILLFHKYLNIFIPEHVKINKNLDDFQLFNLSRNLEEYINNILSGQKNIINVDNVLYYNGDIHDLVIKILVKSNEVNIFPNNFFKMERFSDFNTWNNIPNIAHNLLEIISKLIGNNLELELTTKLNNSWGDSYFEMFTGKKSVLISDLEKSQLGRFLYLLYLRDLYKNNPNVCVIISDLLPLVNRVKEIEAGLVKYSKAEFLSKYPVYGEHYDFLKQSYMINKSYTYRLTLLLLILKLSSPSIDANLDKSTGKITVEITETFKKLFNRCQQTSARYIITFFTFDTNESGHANILIVDKKEKNIERFEPNGYNPIIEDYSFGLISEQIDVQLSKYFTEIGYVYIPPIDFCPKLGIQALESIFYKDTGFCVSWSIIYAEERISSTLPRTYIAQNLITDIINKHKLQSRNVTELGKNIEDWMKNRISKIFSSMDLYYQDISKLLGIHVNYTNTDEGISCLYF